MDVLLAKLLLESKQSRRNTMLSHEDLDRFARQCRHKLLNPDPILGEIARLKAELEVKKEVKIPATKQPKGVVL
jgi:hypothetical protein